MIRGGPATELRHPAFEPLPALDLGDARLTDRHRIALVFQAAALLGLLEEAGWHLEVPWSAARMSPDGVLRLPQAMPGPARELPQRSLRDFVVHLFGDHAVVAGRGTGRRAARVLLERWSQNLTAIAPSVALADVIEQAPYLWEPAFAATRQAMVGELRLGERWALFIAGGRRLAARVGAQAGTVAAARELLAGDDARRLWFADGPGVAGRAHGFRWRAAWEEFVRAGSTTCDPLGLARELAEAGQFEKVLAVVPDEAGEHRLLRFTSLCQLGRLGAAQLLLRQLEKDPLTDGQVLRIAGAAIRLAANLGDSALRERWLESTLAAGRREGGAALLEARLEAAGAAYDEGDQAALAQHLDAAAPAADHPRLAWRWWQARGLLAMLEGDGEATVDAFARALGSARRAMSLPVAAGIWNDLGYGRAGRGDLAGAERAFFHAQRLMAGCEGPRRTTLALFNLAEIRLRRGNPRGVRDLLERSSAENRLAGNVRGGVHDDELWARYELLQGRAAAALAHVRRATDRLARHQAAWQRAELHVLAARAHGWLGQAADAARELAPVDRRAGGLLEPEEGPALWAHAGRPDEALAVAVGTPFEAAWRALLGGQPPADSDWQPLEQLEPYRAARLVFDAELALPGAVPGRWRRRAIETLHHVGALPLAQRLAAREVGPWAAIRHYCEAKERGSQAVARLFAEAGYPDATLIHEGSNGDASEVLFGAGTGVAELVSRTPSGCFVLRAPAVDDVLATLFALAVRELAMEERFSRRAPVAGDGLLGKSPLLLAAIARLDKLAASPVPVLIGGESGTGKELAARRLHRVSARAAGPFIAVNCAALSETLVLSDLFGHVRGAFTGADRDRAGIFETARGGTVLLDEIGDLPPAAQGMLLRVLQESEVRRLGESTARKVDVRIVAATHRDLAALVAEGSFRQDLYYRLRVGALELPPLRHRADDVLELADHFLAGARPVARLAPAARARLVGHTWPGNVRELKNVLAVAAAFASDGIIAAEHLDLPTVREGVAQYHQAVDAYRRRLLTEALAAAGGNRAEAARRLGLTRQALSYLARQLKLDL